MSEFLFSLRGVPEDEAEQVRALLTEHKIDFYETDAGNWGISMPALWVRDTASFQQARELLVHYQQQRFIEQRTLYNQQKQHGRQRTLWQIFWERPVTFVLSLSLIGLIIYLSIRLLRDFGL